MAANQLTIVRIASVTEGPTSKNGGISKHVVTHEGKEWNDWDQGHWPAYQPGRTIGVELVQNGQYLNVGRGPNAVDPNPVNLAATFEGTYQGGQLAPASGLVAKDLSIHRQKALDIAKDTLGYTGRLGGMNSEEACNLVLEVAEVYRRWLDQEAF